MQNWEVRWGESLRLRQIRRMWDAGPWDSTQIVEGDLLKAKPCSCAMY